jgi:signal transduction histidine kinase
LPILGDKELLTQMIANLLDNALQHTARGVRIEIVGKRTRDGISLSLADNGPGVTPQELEAIFQRFYRADAARASAGSGLGLSLVTAIAEMHGLECRASDNGPGLRVTLATADDDE